MQQILPSLGGDVVVVAIDVDPNEDAAILKKYAEQNGFPWRHAVAPRDMLRALSDTFGAQFLQPTSEPMFIIDTRGGANLTPFGRKDEQALRTLVARARVG